MSIEGRLVVYRSRDPLMGREMTYVGVPGPARPRRTRGSTATCIHEEVGVRTFGPSGDHPLAKGSEVIRVEW